MHNSPQQSDPMFGEIARKLDEIEAAEHVRILYAAESGSRAWGFASKDSDYDVRFIYVRRQSDYLRLNPMRDVIEWQLDEVLDINGWDVSKALRLLHASNPTLFEWCQSPIVYRRLPAWEPIAQITSDCFNARTALAHYLHMAENQNKIYLQGDEVKCKKYFYTLRPVLACKWVLQEGTPPPVEFQRLADSQLPPELQPAVDELLRRKRDHELETSARIEPLNRYLDGEIASIRARLAGMRDRTYDWEELNRIFLCVLDRTSL